MKSSFGELFLVLGREVKVLLYRFGVLPGDGASTGFGILLSSAWMFLWLSVQLWSTPPACQALHFGDPKRVLPYHLAASLYGSLFSDTPVL